MDMSRYGDDAPDNPYASANVIAHPLLRIGGRTVATRVLDCAALERLHELDGVEANVARGYHAIDFLLWGQGLNGTVAGARPTGDFDTTHCGGGHCTRCAAYLRVLTEALIGDLDDMECAREHGGKVRHDLLVGLEAAGLQGMLTGIGNLSCGELAGERMKLGLSLNDPEEEHDCSSDNTHWSHFFDVIGIQNVYLGRYQRHNRRQVTSVSLSSLVAAHAPTADRDFRERLNHTVARMTRIVTAAEGGMRYDQMLAADNPAGNRLIQGAIDALTRQTTALEAVGAGLGLGPLTFEGSDSLDNPAAVTR